MEDTDQKKDQKMDDTEKMEILKMDDSEQQEDIMLSRWEVLSRGRYCIEQMEDSSKWKTASRWKKRR